MKYVYQVMIIHKHYYKDECKFTPLVDRPAKWDELGRERYYYEYRILVSSFAKGQQWKLHYTDNKHESYFYKVIVQ